MTKSKKKVLVGGCFDLIHFGHIHFLKRAKALGSFLIIALESDKNVRRLKGKGRPIHTQKQRGAMLMSLRFVDKVISLPPMKSDEDYRKLVSKLKPDIIAVTVGDPAIKKKREHARTVSAKVVEISKIRTRSTSRILRGILKYES